MRALLITLLLASPVFAEKPRPVMIPVAPLVPQPLAAPTSRIVYMHRCGVAGCAINAGTPDNSRTNTSQIASQNTTIGAFTQSDDVWKKMVLCVKATFAPFNIEITEQDPGPSVEHYEHVVGGKPTQLDPTLTNAGGVASFRCGGIDNAMNFTFDVYGADPDTLCWTAAQEIAHGFGLEHELNARDPLTYLAGYLPKRFQAAPTACGEGQPRTCACTGGMQSTYNHILDMFGAGTATPPTVAIKSPTANKTVQPKFVTRVDVMDDSGIDHVELIIDGSKVPGSETSTEPYTIVAPDTIEQGPHQLEVRAYDVAGTPASAMIDITMGPPCTASSGCTGSDVCVVGVCIPGPDAAGGLGYDCSANSECISRTCLKDQGQSYGHCVEQCDPAIEGVCPSGFECLADAAVCWPNDSGGGCCDAGTSPGGPLLLGFGILVIVLRTRRGARRPSARGGRGWGWCARDRASTEPEDRG